MEYKFGDFDIKTRELDNKLLVQFTSDLGIVSVKRELGMENDFPNSIVFHLNDTNNKPRAMSLKKIKFGAYKFILGVNFDGELVFFHPEKLHVGLKTIDGQDTLSLSMLKEPK